MAKEYVYKLLFPVCGGTFYVGNSAFLFLAIILLIRFSISTITKSNRIFSKIGSCSVRERLVVPISCCAIGK